MIEYPRSPPGSSSLRALGLVGVVAIVGGKVAFCLKRTKFLIWGTGHSGHALSLIMIPIEGARVEEEEETFSKARSMSPNLYR